MHANIYETNDNFSMIITKRKHRLSEATKFTKFRARKYHLFIYQQNYFTELLAKPSWKEWKKGNSREWCYQNQIVRQFLNERESQLDGSPMKRRGSLLVGQLSILVSRCIEPHCEVAETRLPRYPLPISGLEERVRPRYRCYVFSIADRGIGDRRAFAVLRSMLADDELPVSPMYKIKFYHVSHLARLD